MEKEAFLFVKLPFPHTAPAHQVGYNCYGDRNAEHNRNHQPHCKRYKEKVIIWMNPGLRTLFFRTDQVKLRLCM